MAKKKQIYSCDFETTTNPNDCRVWAYGYMNIMNLKDYQIGNSLDAFMDWVKKCDAILYFHNLRFDGEFIVNWLLHNGFTHSDTGEENTFNTIISAQGQWYMIDICYGYKGKKKLHTTIYDSLKKLPFPVKVIAKAFNLPILKGDIDYHAYRPIGHEITEKEYAYIKNDIEIVARALVIQFGQGLEKMTIGSDSFGDFKAIIGKQEFERLFPVFTMEYNERFRAAYRGGFTWLNPRYANQMVGEGIVFDVNSLYPFIMYDRPMPCGTPIDYYGEYVHDPRYPLWIQHIRCEFELKPNKIPTIQLKKTGRFADNEYLSSSNFEIVDLYVTNVDWQLILEHYDVRSVEFLEGHKFKQVEGIFQTYINKWNYVKMNSEGALRTLAKLLLNNLYGKFATNPDVTGKEPYLKEDGSTGFRIPKDENGVAIPQYKDPIYTPVGVFITAYARELTIRTAQKCYHRIIYCDTDSIHLEGAEVPVEIQDIVHDKKLGHWKHEVTFHRAKFVRQKTYAECVMKTKTIQFNGQKYVLHREHVDMKCAGMPDNIKRITRLRDFSVGYSTLGEMKPYSGPKMFYKKCSSKLLKNVSLNGRLKEYNFSVGYESRGKLTPKHVKGGVVLVDQTYTLKK